MSLFLTQFMNGVGNGAVLASLALALVLIFRTTGILNFAQGEMALYSTYLVWFFTARNFPVWLFDTEGAAPPSEAAAGCGAG